MISLNSIRKIICEECQFHVSVGSIEALRSILEDVARKISEEAMNEFGKLNENRKKHGLRELKRLNVYAIQKGAAKVLNDVFDVSMGLQVNESVSPGGERCGRTPPKFAVEIQ
jgi:hypothetical protein